MRWGKHILYVERYGAPPPQLPVGPCHSQPSEESYQSGWLQRARRRDADPVATHCRQVSPSPEGGWEAESSVPSWLNYSSPRWRRSLLTFKSSWVELTPRWVAGSLRSWVDVTHRRRKFGGFGVTVCYCKATSFHIILYNHLYILRVARVYTSCPGREQVLHSAEVDTSSPGSKYSWTNIHTVSYRRFKVPDSPHMQVFRMWEETRVSGENTHTHTYTRKTC